MRRRELLLAAAGFALAAPASARAAGGDPAILADLIVREQQARLAYGIAARSGAPHAALFGIHDDQHVAALAVEQAAYGINAPPGPSDPAQLTGIYAAVAGARGDAYRAAAVALERELVAAYSAAVEGVSVAKALQTVATVLASHSQHLALLEMRGGLFAG